MENKETPKDLLITCDSQICSYCVHNYTKTNSRCIDCDDNYSNFIGVECYMTPEDN